MYLMEKATNVSLYKLALKLALRRRSKMDVRKTGRGGGERGKTLTGGGNDQIYLGDQIQLEQ